MEVEQHMPWYLLYRVDRCRQQTGRLQINRYARMDRGSCLLDVWKWEEETHHQQTSA